MQKNIKIIFLSKDRLRLVGIWHIPDISTKNAVILVHGITTDKDEEGIFADLADKLCKEGFAVFRFDFRGHGESGGMSVDMTISGELKDLDAAVGVVETRGFKRIGLLGASFGGGIAVLFAAMNQRKLKILCLWNPCLNYDHCFLNPTLPWIREKKAHMKKDLLEKGRTELGSSKFKLGKPLFEEMDWLKVQPTLNFSRSVLSYHFKEP